MGLAFKTFKDTTWMIWSDGSWAWTSPRRRDCHYAQIHFFIWMDTCYQPRVIQYRCRIAIRAIAVILRNNVCATWYLAYQQLTWLHQDSNVMRHCLVPKQRRVRIGDGIRLTLFCICFEVPNFSYRWSSEVRLWLTISSSTFLIWK